MWEYKIVDNYYTTEAELNLLGEEGWELIEICYHKFYFKRPKVVV